MALSATHLKQINLGNDSYDISAKYMHRADGTEMTLEQIVALHNLEVRVVSTLPPAGVNTLNALYLVPHSGTGAQNIKDEYITYLERNYIGETYYRWEKVGSTEIDVSNFATWGTYAGTAAEAGGHTHTVSGTVTVPTVEKTDKKLDISRSTDVALNTASKATVLKGVQATGADKALGEATTFTTSVVPTTTNIKATASGAAVEVSASDAVLGADTTFNVSGGALTGATQAAFDTSKFHGGTATTPAVIDTTKFNGGSMTPGSVTGGVYSGATQASFTQGAKASFTQGAKAAWSASVDANGVLSFSFTANGDDTFTANGDDSFTPNNIGTVSEISYTAPVLTAASLGTGFYTAGTKGTAASIDAGIFTPNSIGSVSDITVTANADDNVTAATDVSMSAQPTIALATGATAGSGVISVATGITSASTTAGTTDIVDVISGVSANGTEDVLTNVTVSAQPAFSLDGNAATGVDYVSAVTIGSTTENLTNGSAATAGAHTHTTSTSVTKA